MVAKLLVAVVVELDRDAQFQDAVQVIARITRLLVEPLRKALTMKKNQTPTTQNDQIAEQVAQDWNSFLATF